MFYIQYIKNIFNNLKIKIKLLVCLFQHTSVNYNPKITLLIKIYLYMIGGANYTILNNAHRNTV